MTAHLSSQRRQQQHGATTLVVVMSLFLIVAMLAAFASRNMVYEQRIASNYYRAGVAFEAAEAGVEWALAMLNSDLIDGTCQNSAGGTSDFRSRYLSINQSTRVVSRVSTSSNGNAACYYNEAGGWTCQCPAAGSPLVMPTLLASTGLQPMFSVGFVRSSSPQLPTTRPGRAGTIRVLVNGCTGLSSICANPATSAVNSLGKAEQSVEVALVSALKMPPVAPLVARGQVNPGSPAALGLINSAPGGSGLLVHTGQALLVDDLAKAESLPGSLAGDSVITGDAVVRDQAAELFFTSFFGMNSDFYRTQPKMRTIAVGTSCSGDCTTPLSTQIAAGGQMFWLDAPAVFSTNTPLGSDGNPVVIVVNGDLTINQPLQINGLLYVRGNLTWSNSSGLQSTVTGAVVTEGNLTASGAVNIVYDAKAMQILNNQRGSFVRVPGTSWDRGR